MNKETLKKIVYSLGKFLGFVGLAYVLYSLSQEYTFSTFIDQFSLLLNDIPFLVILNLSSTLVGIYAWHLMLLHYAPKPFSYITSYYYFAKTEIAKYLPGNVFHFVGRQALSSKIDIPQIAMAKISLLLTFLLLIGTIIASTLLAITSSSVPFNLLVLMLLSSLFSLLIILYVYRSFPHLQKIFMVALLALSIALQGVLLSYIVMQQSHDFNTNLFLLLASMYVISWLIGFVTPGASGGLGVREGAFIGLTSYIDIPVSNEIIIFSVLLVRLINIFVDVMIYLSTFAIQKKI